MFHHRQCRTNSIVLRGGLILREKRVCSDRTFFFVKFVTRHIDLTTFFIFSFHCASVSGIFFSTSCVCVGCVQFFFVCQFASYVGTDKKLHAPRFKNLNPWLLSMAFYKIRIYLSRSGFWLFVTIFDLIVILLVVISDFFNAFFTAFFACGVCFAVCTGSGSSFAVGDGNGSRGFRGFS